MPRQIAELKIGLRVRATRTIRFLHSESIAAGTEGTVIDIGPVLVHVQFDGRHRPSGVARDEIAPVDVAPATAVPVATSAPLRFTRLDEIPGAL